ncbi:zinc-binding alcohol dehydrogenase family protein [Saccharothrix saharensis]|uniref:Zinc-binding alcohol dehydrogenase family protein n=1 Tax=Saccharothrix saharensis TaxID=571190 RepID=A0A543J5C1_9PSEU|nr:zinc-binding dehydrogenase [Saccharothrix saharensis]TQM78040.1 zinc-binding alcohol dehydrogenase family protein [Saccharothrix saharensis]
MPREVLIPFDSDLPWAVPETLRTAYGGESSDLPAEVLQRFLDRVAGGEVSWGPTAAYRLDDIRQAHDDLEHGRRVGELVVVV